MVPKQKRETVVRSPPPSGELDDRPLLASSWVVLDVTLGDLSHKLNAATSVISQWWLTSLINSCFFDAQHINSWRILNNCCDSSVLTWNCPTFHQVSFENETILSKMLTFRNTCYVCVPESEGGSSRDWSEPGLPVSAPEVRTGTEPELMMDQNCVSPPGSTRDRYDSNGVNTTKVQETYVAFPLLSSSKLVEVILKVTSTNCRVLFKHSSPGGKTSLGTRGKCFDINCHFNLRSLTFKVRIFKLISLKKLLNFFKGNNLNSVNQVRILNVELCFQG